MNDSYICPDGLCFELDGRICPHGIAHEKNGNCFRGCLRNDPFGLTWKGSDDKKVHQHSGYATIILDSSGDPSHSFYADRIKCVKVPKAVKAIIAKSTSKATRYHIRNNNE